MIRNHLPYKHSVKQLSEIKDVNKKELLFTYELFNKLTFTDKNIIDFFIHNYKNEKTVHWYAQETIADFIGTNKRTITNGLKKLDNFKIINKLFRAGKTCLYSINIEIINDFFEFKRLEQIEFRKKSLLRLLPAKYRNNLQV